MKVGDLVAVQKSNGEIITGEYTKLTARYIYLNHVKYGLENLYTIQVVKTRYSRLRAGELVKGLNS